MITLFLLNILGNIHRSIHDLPYANTCVYANMYWNMECWFDEILTTPDLDVNFQRDVQKLNNEFHSDRITSMFHGMLDCRIYPEYHQLREHTREVWVTWSQIISNELSENDF